MFGQILTVIGVIAMALAVILVAFVIGMRTKSPLAVRAVRALSRVLNPIQMRTAGRPGAYASIIRHRGRVSGTAYATPVGVVAIDDGFLIALPYGLRTQWLRNVLASGSAALTTEGRTHDVDRPELVPVAVFADRFPIADQRLFRLLDVRECLRLRRADVALTEDVRLAA